MEKDILLARIPESFVSIDFETLYPQRVSVCSIGMVKYKNGEIVDRFYSLVKPPFDYPGKKGVALTWIHGFTESMLVNERTFDIIWPEFESFIEGLPLVAHNACVEKACIKNLLEYYGLYARCDYECIFDTYMISKQLEKSLGREISGSGMYALDAVCRRFGVVEMEHHNALDDAEMCGNLLNALKKGPLNEDFQVLPRKQLTQSSVFRSAELPKYAVEEKMLCVDLKTLNDNPFENKLVVLTGFQECCKQKYKNWFKELGAIVRDSVSKKTDYLITGYNAGPCKLRKAEEYGVRVLSELEFLEIIKSV